MTQPATTPSGADSTSGGRPVVEVTTRVLQGSSVQAAGAAVEMRDLHRAFGATKALNGLDLSLQPGELVALLGPSGCGKTTALRVLAGFETVDSGDVTVDGHDVTKIPAQRRDMGMVFQSYSLFPNMNALDNVAFGLRMRKRPGAVRRDRAAELLDMVGLSAQSKSYPHQLSGGQQQRVALARALAIEPRVLLLDEPLSALDAKVRLQLREQIRLLQTQLGTTTLCVTHDQEEALSMADRVGVMSHGLLEQIASPADLYASPATAFVAQFVGTMNRIPATIFGDKVEVLGAQVGIRGSYDKGGPAAVDVLVRPEGLKLSRVDNGAGVVTTKTFLGSLTRVSVLFATGTEIKVDLSSGEAAMLAGGDSVNVEVTDDNVLVTEARPA
jgi:putative spermidine/putrescine transport system ATP-binding protein